MSADTNNMAQGACGGDMFGWAGKVLRQKLGKDIATVALAAPCGDVGYHKPGGGRTFKDEPHQEGPLALLQP